MELNNATVSYSRRGLNLCLVPILNQTNVLRLAGPQLVGDKSKYTPSIGTSVMQVIDILVMQ